MGDRHAPLGAAQVTSVQLTVNGNKYTVGPEVSSSTLLIDFLRDVLHLTGSKVLCREGGCGLCTVVATVPDPETTTRTFSVLACQQLVYACHGWTIETIENLGDRYNGYHPLQKALAGFYGTQCGYCSPGMVMTMYGQLKSSGSLTESQVEKSLDGNLCRCTGYRPILDAFKSLAEDGSQHLKDKLEDIEEVYKSRCLRTNDVCQGSCSPSITSCKREIIPCGQDTLYHTQWYQPTSLSELYDILKTTENDDEYYIVVGNTGPGVYKEDSCSAYINSGGVSELYAVEEGESQVKLGANVSLTRAIEMFQKASRLPGFSHLDALAQHWGFVANVGVRNMGSIAGNLMLKHKHPEFPSDIFVTLLGVDARLTLGHAADASTSDISLEDFMKIDMSKSIILSIRLPKLTNNTQIRTFKVAQRAVNSHAHVNAAFRFEIDPDDDFKITTKPKILYGGINPSFIHAERTEEFLTGRRLSQVGLVVEAARILKEEVIPDSEPQDASPEFRSSLTQTLLYKAVISLLGDKVNPELISGGNVLQRPLTTAKQTFTENHHTCPVGKPIPKVESIYQVSGEADFMNDAAALPNELHGAFIHTTVGRAKIKSIDVSEALMVPGVVTVVTAEDIPGTNNFILEAGQHPEEVFVSSQVCYAGQGVGVVVATDRATAVKGARKVKVSYEDVKTPVLTIKEAVQEGWVHHQDPCVMGDVHDAFQNCAHIINGEFEKGSQFHFAMEPLAARVVPIDDGYDVTVTTAWTTEAQSAVSHVLGIDANSVNVAVRRIGGSFGGKITRGHLVCAAAAVAARKSQRPVRIALDLNSYMSLIGGREPFYTKYKVGFDKDGKLQGIEEDLVFDAGYSPNETAPSVAICYVGNVYSCPNWLIRSMTVTTNTPSNAFMRAPGISDVIATIEHILDQIAQYLGKDPLEVRELNLAPDGAARPAIGPIQRNVFRDDILPLLKDSADYQLRRNEVASFNKMNRWRKRGLSLMPLGYNLFYLDFRYSALVSICSHDGTVSISHGGIEMGQGINTKVSQIAAYILGVPLEMVKVKATSTTANANSTLNGATICSDIVCHGVKTACENLIARINAFKEKLVKETGEERPWAELVRLSMDNDIDISERFWTKVKDLPKAYDIWGGACVEVELDVLTGQYQILRADIIEDCGQSLSPYVDIGQVEGAFIMGLGLYTTEKVSYNHDTGLKLSNGTWEYKVLTAADLPVDLRVTLLPNSYNTSGILRAKACGEPPLCLSYCSVMALREAITAARAHTSHTEWFAIDIPLTVEKIQQLCMVESSQFVTTTQE